MRFKKVLAGVLAGAMVASMSLATFAATDVTYGTATSADGSGGWLYLQLADLLPEGVAASEVYGVQVVFSDDSASVIAQGAGGGIAYNRTSGWEQVMWCNGCGADEQHDVQIESDGVTLIDLHDEAMYADADVSGEEGYWASIAVCAWWGNDTLEISSISLLDEEGNILTAAEEDEPTTTASATAYLNINNTSWSEFECTEFTADITGNGTYTVSLIAEEAQNLAQFNALEIEYGEEIFGHEYIITVDSIVINGDEVALQGSSYTCSADGAGVTTRVNIYNAWNSPDAVNVVDEELGYADQRALEADDYTAKLISDDYLTGVSSISVTFTVSGIDETTTEDDPDTSTDDPDTSTNDPDTSSNDPGTSSNDPDATEDYVLGDVNQDGDIDYLDAMTVLRYDAELIELSETQRAAGDTNGDGYVDSLDAILILRYDADLISSFGS